MNQEIVKNNHKNGAKSAVNQSSAVPIIHELDVHLKMMKTILLNFK
jgi:hypothetical protein